MECFLCSNEALEDNPWGAEEKDHTNVYLCNSCWVYKSNSEKREQIKSKFKELNNMQPPETPVFTVKMIADINTVEINGYGFTAKIKKGLKFNPSTQQYFTNYSVLFENRIIALSQAELRKYIMFLEYVEFYLENLNA